MIIGILYGIYVLFGALTTIYGSTMTYLIQAYKISFGEAGLLITFTSIGRLGSVLVGGILSDRYGRKPLLIAGIICWLVGLIGIGGMSLYMGAIFFAIMIGIGNGVVGAAVNGAIADFNREHLARSLNRLHMFFAIGCTLGPLVSGLILTYNFTWRTVYYLDAFLGLVMLVLIIIQVFPKSKINELNKSDFRLRNILNYKNIVFIALIPFIYSGVGNGINTWINMYMGDVLNLEVFLAAGTLAIYNLGLVLGRFINSIISDRIGPARSILFCSIGAFLFILLLLFNKNTSVIVTALIMVGFFFGGLTPTAVAILGQMYPDRVGTVSALLTIAGSTGSMIIPATVGWIANIWDIVDGMKSLVIPIFILCIVAIKLYKNSNE